MVKIFWHCWGSNHSQKFSNLIVRYESWSLARVLSFDQDDLTEKIVWHCWRLNPGLFELSAIYFARIFSYPLFSRNGRLFTGFFSFIFVSFKHVLHNKIGRLRTRIFEFRVSTTTYDLLTAVTALITFMMILVSLILNVLGTKVELNNNN